MKRNFEHDNWKLEGEVMNTVCTKKVGYPTQETQLLVWPTAAAAFDKYMCKQSVPSFEHDKFFNKTLETYEMYFPQRLL